MKIARLIFVLATFSAGCFAQIIAVPIADETDNQSWNDVQLTIPMSKRVDFFTKLTLRFENNVSRFDDVRVSVGYVWKPTKRLSISPFYSAIKVRNVLGRLTTENRFSLAAGYRVPIKSYGLSHRSTYEYRSRPAVNAWRYRAMFMIDKDLPEKIIPKAKIFIGDEVFYDSLTNRFSRNRFAVGITKTLSKNAALDVYYMRQNDGFARPGDLNIIGTAWKFGL